MPAMPPYPGQPERMWHTQPKEVGCGWPCEGLSPIYQGYSTCKEAKELCPSSSTPVLVPLQSHACSQSPAHRENELDSEHLVTGVKVQTCSRERRIKISCNLSGNFRPSVAQHQTGRKMNKRSCWLLFCRSWDQSLQRFVYSPGLAIW